MRVATDITKTILRSIERDGTGLQLLAEVEEPEPLYAIISDLSGESGSINDRTKISLFFAQEIMKLSSKITSPLSKTPIQFPSDIDTLDKFIFTIGSDDPNKDYHGFIIPTKDNERVRRAQLEELDHFITKLLRAVEPRGESQFSIMKSKFFDKVDSLRQVVKIVLKLYSSNKEKKWFSHLLSSILEDINTVIAIEYLKREWIEIIPLCIKLSTEELHSLSPGIRETTIQYEEYKSKVVGKTTWSKNYSKMLEETIGDTSAQLLLSLCVRMAEFRQQYKPRVSGVTPDIETVSFHSLVLKANNELLGFEMFLLSGANEPGFTGKGKHIPLTMNEENRRTYQKRIETLLRDYSGMSDVGSLSNAQAMVELRATIDKIREGISPLQQTHIYELNLYLRLEAAATEFTSLFDSLIVGVTTTSSKERMSKTEEKKKKESYFFTGKEESISSLHGIDISHSHVEDSLMTLLHQFLHAKPIRTNSFWLHRNTSISETSKSGTTLLTNIENAVRLLRRISDSPSRRSIEHKEFSKKDIIILTKSHTKLKKIGNLSKLFERICVAHAIRFNVANGFDEREINYALNILSDVGLFHYSLPEGKLSDEDIYNALSKLNNIYSSHVVKDTKELSTKHEILEFLPEFKVTTIEKERKIFTKESFPSNPFASPLEPEDIIYDTSDVDILLSSTRDTVISKLRKVVDILDRVVSTMESYSIGMSKLQPRIEAFQLQWRIEENWKRTDTVISMAVLLDACVRTAMEILNKELTSSKREPHGIGEEGEKRVRFEATAHEEELIRKEEEERLKKLLKRPSYQTERIKRAKLRSQRQHL